MMKFIYTIVISILFISCTINTTSIEVQEFIDRNEAKIDSAIIANNAEIATAIIYSFRDSTRITELELRITELENILNDTLYIKYFEFTITE